MYAFKSQIEDLANYKAAYIPESDQPPVAPDALLADFEQRFGGATSVKFYPDANRSVVISSFSRNSPGVTAYYNPYTGDFLGAQGPGLTAFFAFILDLHRFLLAGETGKVINGVAILIFLFMLLSGFILWLPKKIKQLKQGLTIRWKARFYRLNYDLHNVLGFYTLLALWFIALTGLYVSFHWMKNLMIVSLGGNSIVISDDNLAIKKDLSDAFNATLENLAKEKSQGAGATWNLESTLQAANEKLPYKGITTVTLPNDQIRTVQLTKLNNDNALNFYLPDAVEFSLSGQIRGVTLFADQPLHEQFKAIAKPLHTGEIMGLPGIIFYFLVSLIGSSLPVTGFIIWWKKAK